MVPTLVWAYIAVAIFAWASSGARRLGVIPPPYELIADQPWISRSPTPTARLGRILRDPSYTIRAPRNMVNPQVRWYIFSRRPIPLASRIRAVTDSRDELFYSTTLLWLAFLLYVYDDSGHTGHANVVGVVAWILLICVATRQTGYLLRIPDPVERMRRGFGLPWVGFLKLAGADFVVVVLSTWWVTGHRFSRTSDVPSLWDQVTSFVGFQDAFTVWYGRSSVQLSASGISTLIVRILFSMSVAAALVRFRSFKRTDEDRVSLARTALSYGAPAEAEAQLDQVKVATSATLLQRAQVALAQKEPDEAWRLVALATKAEGLRPQATESAVILGRLHSELPFQLPVLVAYLASLRRRKLPEGAAILAFDGAAVLTTGSEYSQDVDTKISESHPILVVDLMLSAIGPDVALDRLSSLRGLGPADRIFRELVRLKCQGWMAIRDGSDDGLLVWRRESLAACFADVERLDHVMWASQIYSFTVALGGQFPHAASVAGLSTLKPFIESYIRSRAVKDGGTEAEVAELLMQLRSQAGLRQVDLEDAIRRSRQDDGT